MLKTKRLAFFKPMTVARGKNASITVNKLPSELIEKLGTPNNNGLVWSKEKKAYWMLTSEKGKLRVARVQVGKGEFKTTHIYDYKTRKLLRKFT
jgi:hypothetical protein